MKKPHLSIVAAIGRNRALGMNGTLLWRIPDDLKRFKALTTGHPIIFGRKTYESIGRPLPGRTTIVITRDPFWMTDGVIVAHSLDEALEIAKDSPGAEEIHIGGGAQLYEQAFPIIDKLYLTLIDDEKEGDAFFPPYKDQFTKKTYEEEREWNGLTYRWIDLERA